MTLQDGSGYEDALGDSLQALLASGADDLQALADGLNARGPAPLVGELWTPSSLAQELRRLAADCPSPTSSHSTD